MAVPCERSKSSARAMTPWRIPARLCNDDKEREKDQLASTRQQNCHLHRAALTGGIEHEMKAFAGIKKEIERNGSSQDRPDVLRYSRGVRLVQRRNARENELASV